MNKLRLLSRNLLITLVTVMQISVFPLAAYAEDAPASSVDPASSSTTTTQTEPVPAPSPAPSPAPAPAASPAPSPSPSPSPAPAANSTPAPAPSPPPNPYVLNTATGNYENDSYIWNPKTNQTIAKMPGTYSYNPATGRWESGKWAYDPATGKYVPNVPISSPASSPSPAAGSQQLAGAGIAPLSADPSGLMASPNLGPNSSLNGPIYNGANSNDFFSGFYNAAISNNIYSTARSGDAAVTQNTVGGNALSGNAKATANLINILQSSFSPGGSGNVATFVANIDGNVVGDIMLDPGSIPKSKLGVSQANSNNNLTVNAQNNGQITNNINLAAESGNAKVANNTEGGNATSGSATAIANVVNMINSNVAAGNSFFGIININGNLNGDILVPPSDLDYLLASTAPRTTVPVSSLTANLTNNQTINNNVKANAQSGAATVSHNTSAGNATTGNATTNVTILNLTGSNIIAKNSLLVFVNVLGTWVGLIVNAPAGSTSAAYGGGVTANSRLADNTEVNAENNSTITNDITVSAKTGDAEVSNNTEGGNATTGNAKAGANIANIMNSSIALSDWFGILFINVFGNWHGSFGVDTAAGTLATSRSTKHSQPQLVAFRAGSENSNSSGPETYGTGYSGLPVATADYYDDSSVNSASGNGGVVLASANTTGPGTSGPQVLTPKAGSSYINWTVAGISILLLAGAITIERFISLYRNRGLTNS